MKHISWDCTEFSKSWRRPEDRRGSVSSSAASRSGWRYSQARPSGVLVLMLLGQSTDHAFQLSNVKPEIFLILISSHLERQHEGSASGRQGKHTANVPVGNTASSKRVSSTSREVPDFPLMQPPQPRCLPPTDHMPGLTQNPLAVSFSGNSWRPAE